MKNFTITSEQEGLQIVLQINQIEDLLQDILAISKSSIDFIKKVTYALTDETNCLSKKDQDKLDTYYEINIWLEK
mgnify:CR=1 FL=1|tara:strand:- start:4893 stop:5117 length:225 start_codon:yes stop_codon:yes gene_type:complete